MPHSLRSPYSPLARPPTADRPLHVVLATTGSVASVKTPLIIEALLAKKNIRIQVVSTASSLHFYDVKRIVADVDKKFSGQQVVRADYSVHSLAAENAEAAANTTQASDRPKELPRLHFWRDEDEWKCWREIGDPILHIELRRWADVVLVAPCSANTLAKIHAGLCDDLLTSFLRARSPTTPVLLFPAMNTLMHMHPLTDAHVTFASETLGYQIYGPIEKRLACGDLGQGAMFEWTDIVGTVVKQFALEG